MHAMMAACLAWLCLQVMIHGRALDQLSKGKGVPNLYMAGDEKASAAHSLAACL